MRKFIKCPHITRHLDCLVGGFGNLQCLHEDFHATCRYKQGIEEVKKQRTASKNL